MIISFISPFEFETAYTGGQIYDYKFIDIIDKKTPHSVNKKTLATSVSKKYPFLAPFAYLKESLKDKSSDLVISNSAFYMRFMLLPFFLKKLGKKKMMTIHHHFMYRQFKGFKRWSYKFFEWRFLKSMDKIVVASPYVYNELKNKIGEEKLLFYRIPFQTEPKTDLQPTKGNLTFTGTIEERKGLHLLLDSIVELKKRGRNYPLTIMGKVIEPLYFDRLKKTIEENGLDVRFTGFLSRKEMDKILSESDVFVFPSLLEGYGMVLIEAQVYGLPIVSFDNSAMPYNVKNDNNGFAVKTGDSKAFADAVEKIVEDREIRERLSKGAYQNLKSQNTEAKFESAIIRDFNQM